MFEVLDEKCTPTKGSKYSACADLYAREDIVIGTGETVLVPLGVKIDLEMFKINKFMGSIISQDMQKHQDNVWDRWLKSHQLNLHIRSSLSAKHGLIIANGTGIIDLDYKGEIMICLHNPMKDDSLVSYQDGTIGLDIDSDHSVYIKKGQRIAQISLVEHKSYLFGVDSEEERTGGFGSTGE